MPDAIGQFALVLHAHLPYVRHPEYDSFMEEDWLFEAACETYIPLIRMMDGLLNDGVHFRLTMSLTPPLLSMFRDPLLQSRLRRHVGLLLELCDQELHRTRDEPEYHRLAEYYQEHFAACAQVLERCHGDLSREFRRLQETGSLEIITCCATHGFLPLMIHQPEAVRAQIQVAVNHYEASLGRRPQGIWLAECGYYPGHEQYLAEAGLRYFFVEAHGVLLGAPRPLYGTFAPVKCPGQPVAAFGRDMISSKQVWSSQEGYPGDYNYREFYRDVGFDLDYDYVERYLGGDGTRKNLGLKYYRITGPGSEVSLGDKQPYRPEVARQRAADHAAHFLHQRTVQLEEANRTLGKVPLVVSPYDAELFGHWWWEGVQWIDFLFRKMHFDQDAVRPVTPVEYLAENPELQEVQPEFSSWGYKGYAEFWLNESNDWLYRHLHVATERMIHLARRFQTPTDLERRALNQCARELLLAQASDWAFIFQTGTTVGYARKQTSDHLARFDLLFQGLEHGGLSAAVLEDAEWRDNIFPDIDYTVYR